MYKFLRVLYFLTILLRFGLGATCFYDAVKLWAEFGEHLISLLVLLVSFMMVTGSIKDWRDFRAE